MASKCKYCGEDAVISTNDAPSVSMRVCQECGSVNDENFISEETPFSRGFDNTSAFDFKQSLSKSARNALQVATPQGLKLGKNRITIVGQTFKLGVSLIDDAVNLYERLFRHPDVINKTMINKLLLAAACVYIKMRENDLPVPLRWFCKVSGICANDFSRNFLFVLKCMDIKLNNPSIESEIDIVLEPAKLGSKVMNLTGEIIQLCQKTWIVSGRSHSPVIIAASHIAWYTLNESKGRKSSLRDYCKEFKFSYSRPIVDRSSEIHETIFELGKSLPWVIGSYKDKKLFNRKYLLEIVKYRESLLYNHQIKVTEKLVPVIDMKSNTSHSELKDKSIENSDTSSISTEKLFLNQKTVSFANSNVKDTSDTSENFSKDDDIQWASSTDERPTEIQLNNAHSQNTQESFSSGCNMESKSCDSVYGKFSASKVVYEVVYESDSTLQKNIFIPPILKKPRKRLYFETVEDTDGLDCNDELSEAHEHDVDQYIRSEEEIREIKQLKH